MTAGGTGHRRLTITETGQASSQPSWLPDASGLFRRSGPTSRVGAIWQMGPLGEAPGPRFAPPAPPLYPSQLTGYAGADESPDWQAIPAPRTDARCGDLPPRAEAPTTCAGRAAGCPARRRARSPACGCEQVSRAACAVIARA